jgi:hypothetical protein
MYNLMDYDFKIYFSLDCLYVPPLSLSFIFQPISFIELGGKLDQDKIHNKDIRSKYDLDGFLLPLGFLAESDIIPFPRRGQHLTNHNSASAIAQKLKSGRKPAQQPFDLNMRASES